MFDHNGWLMFCLRRCCRSTIAGVLLLGLSAGAQAENVAATEAAKLRDQGLALEGAGKLTEAEETYRKAQAAYEKAFGPANPWVGAMLTQRYQEAIPLCIRAIAILEHAPDPNPQLFNNLAQLGDVHLALKQFADAGDAYARAVAAADAKGGIDQLEIARVLNMQIVAFQRQTRLGETQSAAERALAIRQKALPPDSPLVAQSMEWMGGVAEARRDYVKAESYYKPALAIRDSNVPRDEERIAVTASNLAGVYSKLDRYAAAAAIQARC